MSDFTKATLIRAIRTIAQTAVATIGSAVVLSDVNWQIVVSASILSGILSILTSISTGLPEVDLAEDLEDEDEDLWIDYENGEEDPYEGEEGGADEVE